MKRPTKSFSVKITWQDGTESLMPLADWQALETDQYARMAHSDDPYLRESGKRSLRKISDTAAAKTATSAINAISSSGPRKKSKMRVNVLTVLRNAKRGSEAFKVLFGRWEEEEIRGLTIKLIREGKTFELRRYLITDAHTGESREYSVGSLMTLYSEAKI